MIAVDTNLLVYAHRRDSEWHERAFGAIKELAEGRNPWAIPWPCVHEFLAIVTNPRIYRLPTQPSQAIRQVEFWMESPSLRLLGELNSHWSVLRGLIQAGKLAGAIIQDARVAAICREHGVRELWSADRDFTRLGGVAIRNPLLDEIG